MRISDWSSDVCSSDLGRRRRLEERVVIGQLEHLIVRGVGKLLAPVADLHAPQARHPVEDRIAFAIVDIAAVGARDDPRAPQIAHEALILLRRSEEHTSELQSLMRISYAGF